MAENEIIIKVKSENDTRAGFASAKRDAENAGDDAGHGFMSRFMSHLDGTGGKSGLGGLISGALTTAGGGLSSLPLIGGLIPEAAGSNPYVAAAGIAAIGTAAGALLVEVTGLVSGFAAATAGLGAFALFAMPTFKQLQNDAQQLTTVWNNLQTAQDKLAIAQQNFNADPTKANKAALASAQRGLTTAQTNLQAAQMGLGQDAGPAATAVLKLRDAYNQLSAAIQPQVFKVLGDALKVATTLLPDLKPFATAAGGAIDGLLGKVQNFFQSADFKKWLGQFEKLVAPSITAIGTGIGTVMVAVGKLFTLMSSKDVVRAISIAFAAIAGVINGVAWAIQQLMITFDNFMKAVNAVKDFITGGPGPGQKAGPPPRGVPFHAGGGVVSGGWSVVGEMGPELVNLPSGSYVHPAGSFQLPGGGGGGGGGTQVVINWGPPQTQALVKAIWPNLMLEVRNRGGGGPKSAQIALGQTH